jgi:hypothetical protein
MRSWERRKPQCGHDIFSTLMLLICIRKAKYLFSDIAAHTLQANVVHFVFDLKHVAFCKLYVAYLAGMPGL